MRNASDADLPACAALVVGHALFARYGLDAAGLETALRAGTATGDQVLCACDGSELLGMAWLVATGAFARSPYLRLLAIAGRAVGSGVGSRLMEAVEGSAFARSDDLFLLVNDDNRSARRFYAGRGYVVVGHLRDYLRPGVHETIMRKHRPTARG